MPNAPADAKTPTESTPQPEPQPSTEALHGEPAAASEPPSPPPPSPGLKGSGLRYPDDYPVEELRGKTADEAAAILRTYRDALFTGNYPQPAAETPPQQPSMNPQTYPQQQQPAYGTPQPPSMDLMYSDAAEWQRQWDAYNRFQMQQTVAQASQPFLQSQAQIARNASRSDPEYADVWADFAAEIDVEMSKLPLEVKASPDAWNTAAALVAGRNRRKLALKEAERLAARPIDSGTVATDGGTVHADGGSALDPITALFEAGDPAVKDYIDGGISAQRVLKQARAMGKTPEQYAEMLKKRVLVRG